MTIFETSCVKLFPVCSGKSFVSLFLSRCFDMLTNLFGRFRTKQFYMFIQKEWIEGDPGQPAPPPERKHIRNMVRPLSFSSLLYSELNPRSRCFDRTGGISTSKTFFRCLTSGNTPSSLSGIPLSTAFLSPWSIPLTPRNNSTS